MASSSKKKTKEKPKNDQSQAAKDLLGTADSILKEVDDAEIFRSIVPREHPTFARPGRYLSGILLFMSLSHTYYTLHIHRAQVWTGSRSWRL